jgi:hypothetical protein
MSNPIVEIMPWEYERCFAVGAGRFTANWGTPDAKHYDRSLMEEDRNAQVAAAICELAVAKHTGQYWHGGVWHRSEHSKYRHLPDVGHNIEVRRVRTRNAVMVRARDAGKVVWAARTVDPEYRRVEILGYVNADGCEGYIDLAELTRPWDDTND